MVNDAHGLANKSFKGFGGGQFEVHTQADDVQNHSVDAFTLRAALQLF
ncbi:hypothetical protein K8I31_11880 [bacterium]|nr:hypothetical protein [bacterium]